MRCHINCFIFYTIFRMMMIMNASMIEHPTCIFPKNGVGPIELTSSMQDDFCNIIKSGNITTCDVPGRLFVWHPDDSMIVWGDMNGLSPFTIPAAEEFAVSNSFDKKIVDFLRICIKHGLYINKYLFNNERCNRSHKYSNGSKP